MVSPRGPEHIRSVCLAQYRIGRNIMRDKTLACGEENPTTAPRYEECVVMESVETENPFGEF